MTYFSFFNRITSLAKDLMSIFTPLNSYELIRGNNPFFLHIDIYTFIYGYHPSNCSHRCFNRIIDKAWEAPNSGKVCQNLESQTSTGWSLGVTLATIRVLEQWEAKILLTHCQTSRESSCKTGKYFFINTIDSFILILLSVQVNNNDCNMISYICQNITNANI